MRYKKIAKRAGFIIGTLVILFFLVSISIKRVLLLPPVQKRVVKLLEYHVNSLITGNVKIGRIETDILTSIKIKGIWFIDSEGRTDSITVGYVGARFRIIDLFFKRIHINKLEVKDIFTAISVTPQGELKIPVLPDTSLDLNKSENNVLSDWDLVIDQAIVSNINAIYKDSLLDFEGLLRNTSGTLKIPHVDSMLITLSVPCAYYKSPWWNGTLDTIGTSAVLDLNGITLVNSFVEGSGTTVRGGGRIPFYKKGEWNLSAEAETEMNPVNAIHKWSQKLKPEGYLKGYGSIKGTLNKPLLDFSGIGFNIEYDSCVVDSIKIRGKYGKDELLDITTNAYSSFADFNLNGNIMISDLFYNPSIGKYRGDFRFVDFSIPVIKRFFELPDEIPGTEVKTDGYVYGNGIREFPDTLFMSGEIKGLGESTETPLIFEAGCLNKKLSFKSLLGDNRISGSMVIDSQGEVFGSIKGSLRQINLISDLYTTENIGGVLSVDAILSGNVRKPQIQCFLFSDSLSWRASAVQFLDASLKYSNDSLYINHADLFIDAKLDSGLSFFNIDSIGGDLLIEMSASGVITEPDISLKVNGTDLFYKSFRFDSLSGNALFTSFDSVRWNNLRLHRDNTTVNGHGILSFNKRELKNGFSIGVNGDELCNNGKIIMNGYLGEDSIKGNFLVDGLEISSLSPWIGFFKGFEGRLSAAADLEGCLDNLNGKLKASFINDQFDDSQLAVFDNRFLLADSIFISNSVLKLQGCHKPVNMDLKIPVFTNKKLKHHNSKKNSGYGVVKADSLDLSCLTLFWGKDWETKGLTDIDINFKPSYDEWLLDGRLKIYEGNVINKPERIKAENLNLTIDLSGTVWNPAAACYFSANDVRILEGKIDSLILNGSITPDLAELESAQFYLPHNGLLSLDGRFPVKREKTISDKQKQELNFEIMNFPVILLSSFIHDHDNVIRDGKFTGAGKLRFKDGNIDTDGLIELTGGKFVVPDLKPAIGPVNGKLLLRGDTLFLSNLDGKWGKGSFKADGNAYMDIHGIKGFSIGLQSRNLPFEMADIASVNIQSGKLNISGSANKYLIKGNVNLDNSRFIRDIRIMDLVDHVQTRGMIRRTQRISNEYLKNAELQVRVNLHNNLNVDMNLGYMKLDGNVSITGNISEPGFTGEVELSEGYIYYLDREFRVTKANIYNHDPYRFNPTIELEAYSEIITVGKGFNDEIEPVSYVINLSVQGTLENPQIRLWSEDSDLNEGDIISVLTLGQPLGAIGGDLGERLRVFAGQSLLGFGTRKLEQILGMEKVDIRGDVFNFKSQVNSPRLMLAKRINRHLMLSYETALSNLTKPKVSALLKLSRQLFLEGETDTENSGVDLKFKFSR